MTARDFCAAGNHETAKGCVHAGAVGILGVMAVYNLVAWCYRRERHLAINTALYAAAAAFEVYQVRRHLSRPNGRTE